MTQGAGRPENGLMASSPASTTTDSPSRRLTLLGSVLFCGAACAARTSPGISEPTPRSKLARSPTRSNNKNSNIKEGEEDWFDASSLGHCGLYGASTSQATEVSADVLCPSRDPKSGLTEEYEFIAGIGVGAFGRVLKVEHKALQQSRACKCLAAPTQLESGLVDTEVEVLKTLNHPNVVRLHEVFVETESGNEQSRKVFLITELFEGGDLMFRINHHYRTLNVPMKEGHVAYMMRQLLSAISYCHHKGVVHRDVKPDNIMFVDASAAAPLKLLDFGLAGFAERLRDSTREVSVPRTPSLARLARLLPAAAARWCHVRKQMMQRAGTAFYMAPEMVQVGRYDQKADMFSIGSILSEMLTGWHPFYTPNVDDTASVHARITAPGAVRLPRATFANVSREAIDLCQRLLEKDPRRRVSAVQALRQPWFQDASKPSPYGNHESGAVSERTFQLLRRYNASHKVRRAALCIIASDLPEAQFRNARDTFHALDRDGDGLLSPEELKAGAQAVDVDLHPGEAELMIAVLGGGRGPRAGFREFVASHFEEEVAINETMLQRCFRKFDSDNKGYITLLDVESVLVSRAPELKVKISTGEWLEICAPSSGLVNAADAVLKYARFAEVVAVAESSIDVLASKGALLGDTEDEEESSSVEEIGQVDFSSNHRDLPFLSLSSCTLCAMTPLLNLNAGLQRHPLPGPL